MKDGSGHLIGAIVELETPIAQAEAPPPTVRDESPERMADATNIAEAVNRGEIKNEDAERKLNAMPSTEELREAQPPAVQTEPQHCAHCEGELAWIGTGYVHVDPIVSERCVAFDKHPPIEIPAAPVSDAPAEPERSNESDEIARLSVLVVAELLAGNLNGLRNLWSPLAPEHDLEQLANLLGYSFD